MSARSPVGFSTTTDYVSISRQLADPLRFEAPPRTTPVNVRERLGTRLKVVERVGPRGRDSRRAAKISHVGSTRSLRVTRRILGP